jgi:hypothetical protein
MPTNIGYTTTVIDAKTRARLANADIDANLLRLAEQLRPADYAPIKKILTALGGRWDRRHGAVVFPAGTDVATLVRDTLAAGRTPLPARTRDGYVPTPTDLADEICAYPYHDLTWLPDKATVLEPSAGGGALTDAIIRVNRGVRVIAVEPDPDRAGAINRHRGKVRVANTSIEAFAACANAAGERFDAAVMNPPFTLPQQANVWIEHIHLVWDCSNPAPGWSPSCPTRSPTAPMHATTAFATSSTSTAHPIR